MQFLTIWPSTHLTIWQCYIEVRMLVLANQLNLLNQLMLCQDMGFEDITQTLFKWEIFVDISCMFFR
jgi:hypothetical protein